MLTRPSINLLIWSPPKIIHFPPSTRFSDHCANTVIQTSSAPLYKVQVCNLIIIPHICHGRHVSDNPSNQFLSAVESLQVGWTAPATTRSKPACLLLSANTLSHPLKPENSLLASAGTDPMFSGEQVASSIFPSKSNQTSVETELSSKPFASHPTIRLCQSLHKRCC